MSFTSVTMEECTEMKLMVVSFPQRVMGDNNLNKSKEFVISSLTRLVRL